MVCDGFWFSPEREPRRALIPEISRDVARFVRLKLWKGISSSPPTAPASTRDSRVGFGVAPKRTSFASHERVPRENRSRLGPFVRVWRQCESGNAKLEVRRRQGESESHFRLSPKYSRFILGNIERLTRSLPDSLAAALAEQPFMSLVPLAPFSTSLKMTSLS